MRKKKKTFNKTQASKYHFKNSFQERFGMEINRHDIRELVLDIGKYNNVISSEPLSNRVTAHTMVFKGVTCVILYDKIRHVPVTALTLDMSYKSYSGTTSKHGIERMFR